LQGNSLKNNYNNYEYVSRAKRISCGENSGVLELIGCCIFKEVGGKQPQYIVAESV
jgi:hypothetical protein